MGFFKLGKLDKAEKGSKEPKEPKEGKGSRPPDVGLASGGGASGPSVNDFISKTKTRQKQGLKPSGPELIAYARYLGIDPVVDHDLLWIAEEALAAPLPAEWTEHFDSSDRVFYYNATTHVSSWTHPLEHLYRETYKTIVNFRSSSLATQERVDELHKLQQDCHQMEQEVHQEITAWTEHTDDQGHRFYFNRVKGKSSWTDPRPAKCHILYLKMKMIRILCQQAGVNLTDAKPGGSSRFEPLTPDRGDDGDRQSKRSRTDDERRERKERKQLLSSGGSLDGEDDVAMDGMDEYPGSLAPMGLGEDGAPKKKKKKKKKKDKYQDGFDDDDPGGMPYSYSEPAMNRGLGMVKPPSGGSHDGLDSFGGESAFSQPKVKAGIRLEPLQRPTTLDPIAGAGNITQLHGSMSVPALDRS
jgi:hypothetical protein